MKTNLLKKTALVAFSVGTSTAVFAADPATPAASAIDYSTLANVAAWAGIMGAISGLVGAAFGIRVAIKGVSLFKSGLRAA